MIEPHIDAAIFFAIYLGIVGVVFAMGEPQSNREAKVRAVTLVFCAILAVVMIMWVVLGVLDRVLG